MDFSFGEKKKEKRHFMPIRGGSRGELLAALLDNPPLVPLQLPNSRQSFAIAAVNHGFPSALQMDSVERAEFIPLSSVRAVPRVLETPGQRAQPSTTVRGRCCCPKAHPDTKAADRPACLLLVLAPSGGAKTAPGPVHTRSHVFLPKALAELPAVSQAGSRSHAGR